mmetsp:Transcript_12648/g.23917  ORF Transcript_12648/g.23917 Transcript_12648/m.23917 type:complete len:261 (+) Transcript_12648:358-1140(+)
MTSRLQAVTNSPSTGSSCHQCKSRRATKDLNWCRNMLTMQHGKKRPVCRKKYCDRCLLKFLGEKPPRNQAKKNRDKWLCPACRNICTCAACRRRKVRKSASPKILSAENTPNIGSRRRSSSKLSTDSKGSPYPLGTPSPSVKRKRSDSLTDVLLARTAALALRTPQSAPFLGLQAAAPIPSLSLGSRAPSPTPLEGTSQPRVATIRVTPARINSQVNTMKSIQEKLRRLSELSNVDLGSPNKKAISKPESGKPIVAAAAN